MSWALCLLWGPRNHAVLSTLFLNGSTFPWWHQQPWSSRQQVTGGRVDLGENPMYLSVIASSFWASVSIMGYMKITVISRVTRGEGVGMGAAPEAEHVLQSPGAALLVLIILCNRRDMKWEDGNSTDETLLWVGPTAWCLPWLCSSCFTSLKFYSLTAENASSSSRLNTNVNADLATHLWHVCWK